jgi:NAD(P)-dependent dehydrogenase (short-subunit alcohol dehydrogenase family)
MDLQLTGKVALVTGASKGIGLAVTRTLLAEGARVVAVSRTETPELKELAGPDLLHAPADFMAADAPAQVVDQVVSEFGRLDVLVNNIGGPPPGVTMPRQSFLDGADSDWQAVFELNLFATVRAVRAALPHLIEAGGSIVNVSSTNGRQPSPMNVDYSTAKAGLNALTKALSEEFAPRGVRVNTVSPGPVRTPWWTDAGGAADIIAGWLGVSPDEVLDSKAPELMSLSTGRLVDPQEIADVVVLLASPRSASTTGSDFVVDGGMLKAV